MRSTSSNWRARVATFTSAALLSLTTVAIVTLSAALFPHRLPAVRDPQVVDVVFDDPTVIWAARLLLVSAAFVLAVGCAFVVASTVVRTRNGDWLKRVGPFEVSENVVADLEDQVHMWRSAAYDFHDAFDLCDTPSNATDGLNEEVTLGDDYDTL